MPTNAIIKAIKPAYDLWPSDCTWAIVDSMPKRLVTTSSLVLLYGVNGFCSNRLSAPSRVNRYLNGGLKPNGSCFSGRFPAVKHPFAERSFVDFNYAP